MIYIVMIDELFLSLSKIVVVKPHDYRINWQKMKNKLFNKLNFDFLIL